MLLLSNNMGFVNHNLRNTNYTCYPAQNITTGTLPLIFLKTFYGRSLSPRVILYIWDRLSKIDVTRADP